MAIESSPNKEKSAQNNNVDEKNLKGKLNLTPSHRGRGETKEAYVQITMLDGSVQDFQIDVSLLLF